MHGKHHAELFILLHLDKIARPIKSARFHLCFLLSTKHKAESIC